jgi:hypothetical protein
MGQKIEKSFWRDRDSRREMLKFNAIACEHPDLFNASLTKFFFTEMKKILWTENATSIIFLII